MFEFVPAFPSVSNSCLMLTVKPLSSSPEPVKAIECCIANLLPSRVALSLSPSTYEYPNLAPPLTLKSPATAIEDNETSEPARAVIPNFDTFFMFILLLMLN